MPRGKPRDDQVSFKYRPHRLTGEQISLLSECIRPHREECRCEETDGPSSRCGIYRVAAIIGAYGPLSQAVRRLRIRRREVRGRPTNDALDWLIRELRQTYWANKRTVEVDEDDVLPRGRQMDRQLAQERDFIIEVLKILSLRIPGGRARLGEYLLRVPVNGLRKEWKVTPAGVVGGGR